MERRTETIVPAAAARNVSAAPAQWRPTPPLPAKDFGRVVVVQGPHGFVSLVRFLGGRVTCDCPIFAAKHLCPHVASAARLLQGTPV